ncbi:8744_t:CDS:2, partial [Diversispora eburnea]
GKHRQEVTDPNTNLVSLKMTDLQLLYKAIRDFFDETPVEEWSYILFLESFKPVIMSVLDIAKRDEKATWRKRFIKRLEKIADDDAYTEQQRKNAILLKEKGSISADLFWDNIEKEKDNLRRRREDSVRHNTEVDALNLLETARAEKTKIILNSLKRKPEDIVNTKKRCKLPENDSEYYECSDSGESEAESTNEEQGEEEIRGLSQDEVEIRNKLLKILTARQEKDREAGKNF